MSDPAPQIVGRMRFVQHVLPALDAGTYRLTLHQAVAVKGARPAADAFGDVVHFAVAGDRFALASTTVDSVFPPSGTQGEYSNCLAHVVLTSRTLPWERTPTGEPPVVGNQTDDVPSWLALLVFAADEAPPVQPLTLADLVTPPHGVVSYPALKPEAGEAVTDPCAVIDVPAALFTQIAPSLADLHRLAHVRVSAKKAARAVVVANRLPAAGVRSFAHLVSLEGLSDLLPPASVGAQKVRLATLTSWAFDSMSKARRFADVLETLETVGPMCAEPVDVGDATAEDGAVATAVRMGYVAIEHRLRDGGRTASWYRGPLLPYRREADPHPGLKATSADAALRYDPATGLFDASYAAAWQLGRMLALASPEFNAELVRWKRSVTVQCINELEQAFLARRIAADPGLPHPARRKHPPAEALADPELVARAAVNAPALPALVTKWLDLLRGLHGVPYPYLVPSEAVLGPETLRFFHLDPRWVDALVDGAFSLGSATAGDDAAVSAARAVHDPPRAPDHAVTGLILRSAAVRDWPGLQASPYRAGAPLRLLRHERIAPDVLLCLVRGSLDRVDIHEPPEGLHFGFQAGKPPDDASLFSKPLRDPKTAGSTSAAPIAPIPYRAGTDGGPGGRVVEIDTLAAAMAATTSLGVTITAAELALELVEGVGLVSFQVGAK